MCCPIWTISTANPHFDLFRIKRALTYAIEVQQFAAHPALLNEPDSSYIKAKLLEFKQWMANFAEERPCHENPSQEALTAKLLAPMGNLVGDPRSQKQHADDNRSNDLNRQSNKDLFAHEDDDADDGELILGKAKEDHNDLIDEVDEDGDEIEGWKRQEQEMAYQSQRHW